MKLSIVVMAHPARADQARHLAVEVGARMAFDYGAGQNATADFAWRLASHIKSDWSIVLEDDAVPIPDFRVQAELALAAAPARSLVSFYTGTSQPRREKVAEAIRLADKQGNSWLECDALLWGVGVAMPTELIEGMLKGVATHPKTRYDTRLGQWAIGQSLRILYTNPSLVDHSDGPSLLQHDAGGIVRRAHRVGRPEAWKTPATRIAGRFDA